MRWKSFLTCAGIIVLTGCDTSAMYERTARQTPVRWPDDVEMCSISISAITKLRIVVTLAKFTSLPGFAAGGGCHGFIGNNHHIRILDDAWGLGSAMKVDNSSYYRVYQVSYDFLLAEDKYFESGMDYDPHWVGAIPATKLDPASWLHNVPMGQSSTIAINGLKWTHYLFYGFQSASPNPKDPGIPAAVASPFSEQLPQPTISVGHPRALLWVGEVYAHRVDDRHKMLVWAKYRRAVTQDAHWLKTRRAMLRKLVDTVTITPLTPERLEKLRNEREAANQEN